MKIARLFLADLLTVLKMAQNEIAPVQVLSLLSCLLHGLLETCQTALSRKVLKDFTLGWFWVSQRPALSHLCNLTWSEVIS